ncbi:uroporphyrinogen decarboxylase family protein [Melioribacter sp. OK-6-Me]|uniref:uroporphyrinogen decarboxylase family protein n=1 Tax=unclassified Melioribacter TaxID=2627329 RepID=UPI003ED9B46F
MSRKLLLNAVSIANSERRRLVMPLLGFPGINLVKSTIKVAQQNYIEHFKVLYALYNQFHPDGMFPLMDLSLEANALGCYTHFPPYESATVLHTDFDESTLEFMKKIEIQGDSRVLSYCATVKKMSESFEKSITCAYVTGPYTLAGLILGASRAAEMTITNPELLDNLCQIAYEKIKVYSRMLTDSGAKVVCVLEPSAVMLGPEQFIRFSATYIKKITEFYDNSDIAIIYHICGNSMHLIEAMCQSGVNGLSIDSPEAGMNIKTVCKLAGENILVIGNINPAGKILNGTYEEVYKETETLLKETEEFPNFVLSTGCDLPQAVPIENIKAFMDAGRNYKLP